jgi:hypothetical protein
VDIADSLGESRSCLWGGCWTAPHAKGQILIITDGSKCLGQFLSYSFTAMHASGVKVSEDGDNGRHEDP